MKLKRFLTIISDGLASWFDEEDKIEQIRLQSLANTRRACILEPGPNASAPNSWRGTEVDWLSFRHLSAGLGFYRASLVATWWEVPPDPEEGTGARSGVSRVDALWWTLDEAGASLRAEPLAGSFIVKALKEDHPAASSRPPMPSPCRQLCEIAPDNMLKAKSHWEWVLENSTDVPQRKLAGEWLTSMLNDLHRMREVAESIAEGRTSPIDGIDAEDWLELLNVGFPENQRNSRYYFDG